MSQAAEPLTQIDSARADLDLRTRAVAALEMSALDVHDQSGQQAYPHGYTGV